MEETVGSLLTRIERNDKSIQTRQTANVLCANKALRLLTSDDVTLNWELDSEYDDNGAYSTNPCLIQLEYTVKNTNTKVRISFDSIYTLMDYDVKSCKIIKAECNFNFNPISNTILNSCIASPAPNSIRALCTVIKTVLYKTKELNEYILQMYDPEHL